MTSIECPIHEEVMYIEEVARTHDLGAQSHIDANAGYQFARKVTQTVDKQVVQRTFTCPHGCSFISNEELIEDIGHPTYEKFGSNRIY